MHKRQAYSPFAYAGVALSGLYTLGSSIAAWTSRGRYLAQLGTTQPDNPGVKFSTR